MAFNQIISANGGAAVVNKDPKVKIRELIASQRANLLSAYKSEDRVRKFESNLIRLFSSTDLQKCAPLSVVGTAMQAAYLGLDLDPILGQAYVLPRNQKNKVTNQWETKATFQIGYQGMIELVRRSGELKTFTVKLVYENEPFNLKYTLDGIEFNHEPLAPSKRGEKIVGVYGIFTLKDGAKHFEWLWEDEILEIKKTSPSSSSSASPWNATQVSKEEMYKKTLIRRAFKSLPKSTEIANVIKVEEATEAGANVNFGVDGGITIDTIEVTDPNTGEVTNQPVQPDTDGEITVEPVANA